MSAIEKYILLLSQFIADEITGLEFEDLFLEMFKSESNILPNYAYDALNKLFLDVDSYCGDPDLRDDEDLDDEMLEVSAKEALKKLT